MSSRLRWTDEDNKMNAVIKITGVQGFMQPDAETVEFVTDGVYCRTEDGYQIFYHESALTGLAGTSTTVDITRDAITVERKGMLNTKMVFREGEKDRFLYDTRFGSATMGIETRKVAASFDDSGGDLSIDYVVNMEHTVASRNKLNMSVRLRS